MIEHLFLRTWRPYAWLALVIGALFGPSLYFDFVCYDDNVLIRDYLPFLQNPGNVVKAFTQHYFASQTPLGNYYRPLVTLSYMTDTWLGGGAPWMYHLTNILLHVMATWLLYLLLKTMVGPVLKCQWAVFPAALVFAVHPLQVMAVAWIPGRNDMMLACFYFAAFWAVLRFFETRHTGYLVTHLVLFALALITKEAAVTIPALALAWLWLVKGERDWRVFIEKTPFYEWLGIGLGWFLIRAAVLGLLATGNPGMVSSQPTMAWKVPEIVIRYYGKTLFPAGLKILPDLTESTPVFGLIVLGLIVGLWFCSSGSGRKQIGFGVLWTLTILVLSIPFSNWEDIRDLGLLEHRMYVPWLGVLLAGLAGFFVLPERLCKAAGSIVCILVPVLSVLTMSRLPYFVDANTFWARAIFESPKSDDVWHNYGCLQMDNNDVKTAEKAFLKAIELNPKRDGSYNNLAIIYFQAKRYDEAVTACQNELRNAPYSFRSVRLIGKIYQSMGHEQLAKEWIERAKLLGSEDYIKEEDKPRSWQGN